MNGDDDDMQSKEKEMNREVSTDHVLVVEAWQGRSVQPVLVTSRPVRRHQ